jgi:hypothetical protein
MAQSPNRRSDKDPLYVNEFYVRFRPNIGDDRGMTLNAFRVEGWSNDYAFFDDWQDLSSPTTLIPREIVDYVARRSTWDKEETYNRDIPIGDDVPKA